MICKFCLRPMPSFDKGRFCNPTHERLYKEEQAFEKRKAMDAFKKEGEPNGGQR